MDTGEQKPDMDSRENIELFVDRFYERMLADEQLAPIFVDVAGIDLLDIDAIHFEIPIKLHRLSRQTRGPNYAIRDLSTGWYQQFDDSHADVVEHSRYARIPGVIEEDAVRVHDTRSSSVDRRVDRLGLVGHPDEHVGGKLAPPVDLRHVTPAR
mgnify:CR=1 FL=1